MIRHLAETTPLPSSVAMHIHPELATLALLDCALVLTERVLDQPHIQDHEPEDGCDACLVDLVRRHVRAMRRPLARLQRRREEQATDTDDVDF